MISRLTKALILGVRIGLLSRKEAEKELKKILKVSRVEAKHAKAILKKAYIEAKKEKAKIERELKKCKVCEKRKSAKRKSTKPRTVKRKPAKRTKGKRR